MKTSYFSTNSNYTNSGSTQKLAGDSYYDHYLTNLSVSHDLTPSFSAYGILDGVYAKSQDRSFQRTRVAPSDIKLGFDFNLVDGPIGFVPEAQVTIPLSQVSESTDEVIVSEGALEGKVGSYISAHFDWLSGYAYAGYLYRSGGRSSLLPYEIQAVKDFDGPQVSIGVWGYQTLAQDTYTDSRAQRDVVTARVNGGSFRFYSINPSLTEAGFSFGLPFSDTYFVRLGAQTTIRGQNTASGSTLWLSLSTSFGSSKREVYRQRAKEEQKKQEKKKKDFIPESYDDENLFQQELERKPEPVKAPPNIETSSPKRKLQEPGATKIGNPAPSGPPIDVKLRSSKPKKKRR